MVGGLVGADVATTRWVPRAGGVAMYGGGRGGDGVGNSVWGGGWGGGGGNSYLPSAAVFLLVEAPVVC